MLSGALCRFTTGDGLELEGFFAAPATGVAETTLVHVHGLAGNFYENPFVEAVGEAVTARGCNFLACNNRGHDYLADLLCRDPQSGRFSYRPGGAAHELLADAVLDLEAALAFVRSLGSRRVVLQGHSHGAIKAAYYLTQSRPAEVVGLSLLSPSDDLGLQRWKLEDGFERALAEARELVDAGRAGQLLSPGYFDGPISAATYLDAFGEGSALGMFNMSRTDRQDFPELRAVRVPVLLVLGTVQEAFLGEPAAYAAAIQAELTGAPSCTVRLLTGARHNYLGFEPQLATAIADWLPTCLES
ncbi:MAG TPA: alpha/beta fold hydrolase [Armatimonadota bacterium]|jgi:alpha-beta hydrolase superfamily lysophospholipase